ncbi:MAG: ASCH domain-containing protein [Thermoguttaceae bacterium]
MLFFRKKFFELIRSGKKTQTIRLWSSPRLKSGQRSYIPGLGYIQVLSVAEVQFDELTDADARPDGFETVQELRAEIRELYAKKETGDLRTFRVIFSLLSDSEQQRIREERKRQKGQTEPNYMETMDKLAKLVKQEQKRKPVSS